MRTDFDTLAVERIDDHVLLITYDRPEVANAKNTRMGVKSNGSFLGRCMSNKRTYVAWCLPVGAGTSAPAVISRNAKA